MSNHQFISEEQFDSAKARLQKELGALFDMKIRDNHPNLNELTARVMFERTGYRALKAEWANKEKPLHWILGSGEYPSETVIDAFDRLRSSRSEVMLKERFKAAILNAAEALKQHGIVLVEHDGGDNFTIKKLVGPTVDPVIPQQLTRNDANNRFADSDHQNMYAFLKHVLIDLERGLAEPLIVAGALAHVMVALDQGHYSEARSWFSEGRKYIREKSSLQSTDENSRGLPSNFIKLDGPMVRKVD